MLPFHNARIKRYPDGSAEILIGSRPFGGGNAASRLPAFLEDGEPPFTRFPWEGDEERAEREYMELERDSIASDGAFLDRDANAAACRAVNVRRAVRRARKAVKDIARSNPWKYFVTLTLDPEKINRYDPVEVWKHLRHWLGNNVRRKGLTYLLVLEHHKDGALHAHGLFNDALEGVDSGTMSLPGRKAPVKVRSEAQKAAFERMGGHVVYNLPSWGWGFSTAIELYGEMDAAINYVCKYIGKEMYAQDGSQCGTPEKIGGRWYYSGGDLQRPTVEWFDVDVRYWEKFPGWFQPEEYPYGSFLTLRVTAEGEILAPYVRNAESNERSDAKHGRGGDQPSQTGVTIAPVPSSDHDEGSPLSSWSGVVWSGASKKKTPVLTASRPARTPPNFEQLTFSGLSNGLAPPAAGPWGGPGWVE